jgi:hypothetical protein
LITSKYEKIINSASELGDIPPEERRLFFSDYVGAALSKKLARETKARNEGKEKLRKLLQSMDTITLSTTWQDAHRMLESHPDYQSDPALLALEKIDVLETFEEHMTQLEKKNAAQQQKQKEKIRRRERLRREAFKVSSIDWIGDNLLIQLCLGTVVGFKTSRQD